MAASRAMRPTFSRHFAEVSKPTYVVRRTICRAADRVLDSTIWATLRQLTAAKTTAT